MGDSINQEQTRGGVTQVPDLHLRMEVLGLAVKICTIPGQVMPLAREMLSFLLSTEDEVELTDAGLAVLTSAINDVVPRSDEGDGGDNGPEADVFTSGTGWSSAADGADCPATLPMPEATSARGGAPDEAPAESAREHTRSLSGKRLAVYVFIANLARQARPTPRTAEIAAATGVVGNDAVVYQLIKSGFFRRGRDGDMTRYEFPDGTATAWREIKIGGRVGARAPKKVAPVTPARRDDTAPVRPVGLAGVWPDVAPRAIDGAEIPPPLVPVKLPDQTAPMIAAALAAGRFTKCPPAYAAPIAGATALNTGLTERAAALHAESMTWRGRGKGKAKKAAGAVA